MFRIKPIQYERIDIFCSNPDEITFYAREKKNMYIRETLELRKWKKSDDVYEFAENMWNIVLLEKLRAMQLIWDFGNDEFSEKKSDFNGFEKKIDKNRWLYEIENTCVFEFECVLCVWPEYNCICVIENASVFRSGTIKVTNAYKC